MTSYIDFSLDLLWIYSKEKYISIIFVTSCICKHSVDFRYFVISEQLSGEKWHYHPARLQTAYMMPEKLTFC